MKANFELDDSKPVCNSARATSGADLCVAEKTSFPQIPSTVWWGVRSLLKRTPSATVDEAYLCVQLKVQETAARQYVTELKRVGILTEDGKATELAHSWRLDQSYRDTVKELVAKLYPPALLQVAPPGDGDRQKAVDWFMHQGLGEGSAKNKAATYVMLSSPDPFEAPATGRSERKRTDAADNKRLAGRQSQRAKLPTDPVPDPPAARDTSQQGGQRVEAIPLNINVQIHISAEATSDQIESIFQAMRRYLYEAQSG